MFEALRKKLKNAQPISQPAQANFEQQDPSNPGSGHQAFIAHESGAGTNTDTLKRALARVDSQLSQTNDPGLKITLLAGRRNIVNQLLRTGGTGLHNAMHGSPVPDVGFPMGTYVDARSGQLNASPGTKKLSPKAAFELAGTARSQISQKPPRGARIAGGADPLSDSYYTRNALGEYPGQFNYDPGLPNLAATGPTTRAAAGIPVADDGVQGKSYAPGRTFQFQHTGPDYGPYARGATTSEQPLPNHHGSRSNKRIVGKHHV
jgi:hypothetical protein